MTIQNISYAFNTLLLYMNFLYCIKKKKKNLTVLCQSEENGFPFRIWFLFDIVTSGMLIKFRSAFQLHCFGIVSNAKLLYKYNLIELIVDT